MYTHIYTHIYTYVYLGVCVYMYIYIYTYIHIYTYIYIQMHEYIDIYMYIYIYIERERGRKGTNGVSTNGVTAIFMFVDRGTFWALPLTCVYLPKSARAYLFPQSVTICYFCSGPISVDPSCPQPRRARLHARVRVRALFSYTPARTYSRTDAHARMNTRELCEHVTYYYYCYYYYHHYIYIYI